MTLHVEARVAERGFDLSLDVAEGETLAVLGPNGAGKSTLLSILAGLLRPDAGRGILGSETLFDVERGHWVPPHQRGISLLAQEPLLFPHLSALENVAFGPRSAGRSRAAARASARHWLAAVEAAELSASRPAQLSGGQAQRVAIARALAPEPKLLLLDEPLAALDVAVAPTLRRMLRGVLADRTAILVTHEVLDALTLADRVIVLGDGVVVEQGATAEVLQRPRHPFTARLAGLNLLTGVRTATGLRMPDGATITGPGTGAIGLPAGAAVRPSAVSVSLSRPHGANVFPVIVEDLEPLGDSVRVRAESMVADVSPGRAAVLGLASGLAVWFTFPQTEVSIYAR
ncbi:MAG: ABC transporter ATP-binding protein [Actinomycetota bacterium]